MTQRRRVPTPQARVALGARLPVNLRDEFKVRCVTLSVQQGDVIELLIQHWLEVTAPMAGTTPPPIRRGQAFKAEHGLDLPEGTDVTLLVIPSFRSFLGILAEIKEDGVTLQHKLKEIWGSDAD